MRYAVIGFILTLIAGSAAAQSKSVCTKADEIRWEAATIREGMPAIIYPPQARQEEREGSVRIQFTIDGDGKVSAMTILSTSGYQDLDAEAARAIGSRIYPQMMCGGIAQEHTTAQSINFRLDHEPAPPAAPLTETKRSLIESILRKLPPDQIPPAYAAHLVDKVPKRLLMEYPGIPPTALKQIVDEVREQLDASRKKSSGLHESQVQYFNSRYSDSELELLEQLVNQPGGVALLKKLSALFQDQRAVTARWHDRIVERGLEEALAKQQAQSSNTGWLEGRK
ncbi:energy transducer TonB [Herbaspirillum sp. WGmk3]|uniref:energy transducer TonB n=1 Tax=Herbaspirillum sp. WGmk3 TaxID=2919925 RepID=UPI002091BE0B|nr:energy transducer TonB [Herbaspirillum sp. WGmk3]MCO4855592.1 energy transducer TonB [Herbaspirillum sp. WGmk3]